MLLPEHVTRITLAERPTGEITATTFKPQQTPISELLLNGPDKVLVRVDWTSIDPAMRGWLNDSRRVPVVYPVCFSGGFDFSHHGVKVVPPAGGDWCYDEEQRRRYGCQGARGREGELQGWGRGVRVFRCVGFRLAQDDAS